MDRNGMESDNADMPIYAVLLVSNRCVLLNEDRIKTTKNENTANKSLNGNKNNIK